MSKIFVYGSLRNGMYNYDEYLKDKSTFLMDGYVKGKLYTLRNVSYPALLQGEHFIRGEVYEVGDDVEKAIDHLEGYDPHSEDNTYNKTLCALYDENKENTGMQINAYMFHHENPKHKAALQHPILENDYIAFMKKQS